MVEKKGIKIEILIMETISEEDEIEGKFSFDIRQANDSPKRRENLAFSSRRQLVDEETCFRGSHRRDVPAVFHSSSNERKTIFFPSVVSVRLFNFVVPQVVPKVAFLRFPFKYIRVE